MSALGWEGGRVLRTRRHSIHPRRRAARGSSQSRIPPPRSFILSSDAPCGRRWSMAAPFRRRTQDVLDAIYLVLSPYVGNLMARSAAVAHCRDLGISGAVIGREEVDALLERLGLGLVIFVGRE